MSRSDDFTGPEIETKGRRSNLKIPNNLIAAAEAALELTRDQNSHLWQFVRNNEEPCGFSEQQRHQADLARLDRANDRSPLFNDSSHLSSELSDLEVEKEPLLKPESVPPTFVQDLKKRLGLDTEMIYQKNNLSIPESLLKTADAALKNTSFKPRDLVSSSLLAAYNQETCDLIDQWHQTNLANRHQVNDRSPLFHDSSYLSSKLSDLEVEREQRTETLLIPPSFVLDIQKRLDRLRSSCGTRYSDEEGARLANPLTDKTDGSQINTNGSKNIPVSARIGDGRDKRKIKKLTRKKKDYTIYRFCSCMNHRCSRS